MDWYLNVLKNYFGFGGRARRKEYWMFVLVNIIFTFVLGILDRMFGWERAGGEGILTTITGFWSLFRGGQYSSGVYMTPIVQPGGYWCC